LQVYLQHDRPVTQAETDTLRSLVRRRGQREPLGWVLGELGFYQIDVRVHAQVLTPRPDTEALVELALSMLPPAGPDPLFVADIGCGTGIVGLAIATARPDVRVYAVDLAPEALANTRANVARLGLEQRVAVLRGDLLDAVPPNRAIDWVVSNPPYIPTAEIDGLMPEVSKWEPRLALDGGQDGLEVVRRLMAQATRARQGLVLEIGSGQAPTVVSLLADAGWRDVVTRRDLAGIERAVGARR
jgi:release factor glutamine methyltransferase